MSTMVKLNGAMIDMDDPCALYIALQQVKLRLISGESIEETEIRSPVTHRRLKLAGANLSELNQELQRLQAACLAKQTGRRQRYAARTRII